LTLLAKNAVGFRNLIKLSSRGFLEGFYRKPRIDRELLEQYHEGIICLSGCVSGEFSRALLRGQQTEPNFDEAIEIATWFHRLFGDRYFIEIQNNGVGIQRQAMEGSIEVANRLGLPLVATSDAHYVNREDSDVQDVLLCINTGRYRTDTNRMQMEGDQFYLRGPEEMYEAFPGLDEAVKRSQEIADQVDIELELGKRHFPTFTPPDEKKSIDYLRELCIEGLKRRYANRPDRFTDGELHGEVTERLDRELGVIDTLGFPNYFLIVWDFVRFASEQGIPATARGSGVGAIVCYALGMSHVCPLEFDLLFERFLDVNRMEAPDIDIDFCKQRRGEVIQYVKDRYGEANVAQIGTFGTLAARAAIRDVGRALGLPIPRVDTVVSKVPEELGITLQKALTKSDELKQLYDNDGEIHELLDFAIRIEGLARNVGTHAAAVVIADQPLDEYVPLQRVPGKEEIITQWSMNDVEDAGLLKMDFLGLRNLTMISKTVEMVQQSRGETLEPNAFPLDDQPTFDLLCRGETKGVFQLESGGIRDLLQRMKPDHFRDIIATNALYRPGPLEGGMVDDYIEVKHGRQKPEYAHPVMEEVLSETHGVMVYQEQVMRILNRLGGVELSSAYTCIKAISKKKLATINQFHKEFIEGATLRGMAKSDAQTLWEMVEKFAGYGFNKSHSTAYALIAYITAYLKAHYPVEFMAALLSCDISGRNFKKKDSLVEHLEDCWRMEIEVRPPNVNVSEGDFTVDAGKVCFGLEAVKGCGGPAAAAIVKQRAEGGPYRSIFDFCDRVDPTQANRSSIESLIKAGAFDTISSNRAQLLAALERAMQAGAAALKDRRSGQKGLFAEIEDEVQDESADNLPNVPEWEDRQRLAFEKEVLGFYLSSHPLAEFEETFKTFCSHTTSQCANLAHRSEVTLGGMLASLKYSHTKRARVEGGPTKYVMFDLEDTSGMIRGILWPDDYDRYTHLVEADAILIVSGVIDKRPGSDEANLIVNELIPIAEAPKELASVVHVRISEIEHGAQKLEQLYEILRGYPGTCELRLTLMLDDGRRVLCRSSETRLEVSPEMKSRVDDLLGEGNFHISAGKRQKRGRGGAGRNGASGGGPRKGDAARNGSYASSSR
jgi:DNA polymerase-3 subunit alpha